MQCALLLGWLFTSQTRQLMRSDGEDGVAILSDFLEISNRHPRLILWSILQHLKCKGEWLWPFYGWKSNCDEFYFGWVGFRELGFLQTLSFLICMTFMPWKTVLRTQLLLSFARIKGLLFIAPGIYGYVSCLDLFGDNSSPAPQRAWKLPLWKNFLRISTNRFKTLILFLSLRLLNWSSNICKRECSVWIFFSETTVYYENGSRGGKIL